MRLVAADPSMQNWFVRNNKKIFWSPIKSKAAPNFLLLCYFPLANRVPVYVA
jgi:hypothetical protein